MNEIKELLEKLSKSLDALEREVELISQPEKGSSKKYELTDETITLRYGTVLHRIIALKDFGDVKKGDLGGFVQSESNLSHEGNCWIYEDARVFDQAQVYGEAMAFKEDQISGKTRISS